MTFRSEFSAKTREACKERMDIGRCEGKFESFYFERATGTCERFEYSGCGGTANRFHTREHCEEVCLRSSARELAPVDVSAPEIGSQDLEHSDEIKHGL